MTKKKIFAFVLSGLIFLIAITSISVYWMFCGQYKDWKTIDIEGCGSLKIPEDWNYFVEDGYIYVADKEGDPVMIQSYSYADFGNNEEGIVESNKYFKQVQNRKTLSNNGLSNGANFGQTSILKDGKIYKNFFIHVGYERRISLIVWDKSVDLRLVKKIAEGFIPIE